jgi:hypothetical protein
VCISKEHHQSRTDGADSRESRTGEVRRHLLEVVEDAVGVGEVPVGEELFDDGEVLAGLGEAGEELLDVALGLLLDEAAEAGEEARLAGRGRAAQEASAAARAGAGGGGCAPAGGGEEGEDVGGCRHSGRRGYER